MEKLCLEDLDLLVFDFDGVMTDNRVLIGENGEEFVFVNRADGMGISMLRARGIPMLILSTEENPVVSARASKLKIPVIQGIKDKAYALQEYCNSLNMNLKRVAYVGNDINDWGVMSIVALRIVPADAHPKIKEIADIVLATMGGYGVIRELVDVLFEEVSNI